MRQARRTNTVQQCLEDLRTYRSQIQNTIDTLTAILEENGPLLGVRSGSVRRGSRVKGMEKGQAILSGEKPYLLRSAFGASSEETGG